MGLIQMRFWIVANLIKSRRLLLAIATQKRAAAGFRSPEATNEAAILGLSQHVGVELKVTFEMLTACSVLHRRP